jgi:hypothetical protein
MRSERDRWEFRSAREVSLFWEKYKNVPERTVRFGYAYEKRFCLGLYLLGLVSNRLLTFPVRVHQSRGRNTPDFTLSEHLRESVDLEVVHAIERPFQANTIEEDEWWSFFHNAVETRFTAMSNPRKLQESKLLIRDEVPLTRANRHRTIPRLRRWAQTVKQRYGVSEVSIILWLDVVYDVGGNCQVFDFIEPPRLDDRRSVTNFAKRMEYAGNLAVQRAIREHLKAGRPVYWMDSSNRLVRQTSDGRRFHVRYTINGDEKIISELPRSRRN